MDSLRKFIEKVQTNEELQGKVVTMSTNDETALNALMRDNGVSEEDINSFNKQEHKFSTTGELSDEELENVAGGGFNWCNGIKLLVDSC